MKVILLGPILACALGVGGAQVFGSPANAQDVRFSQLTRTAEARGSFSPKLRRPFRVIFGSYDDPVGLNPFHFGTLFSLGADGMPPEQLVVPTSACFAGEFGVDDSGTTVAFVSSCDLTGGNTDGNIEIFLRSSVGRIRQLTFSTRTANTDETTNREPTITGDGQKVAFASDADLTGGNPDRNFEIFLWSEESGLVQLTDSLGLIGNRTPSISQDGERIAFRSGEDYAGTNPSRFPEIFLLQRGSGFTQLTRAILRPSGVTFIGVSRPFISADGTTVAFTAISNLTGQNVDNNQEVFLWDRTSGLRQLTDSVLALNATTSITADGSTVAFSSNADLVGENGDGNQEIFIQTRTGGAVQLTHSEGGTNQTPSFGASADEIVFTSDRDYDGQNAAGRPEIFLVRRLALVDVPTLNAVGLLLLAIGVAAVAVLLLRAGRVRE